MRSTLAVLLCLLGACGSASSPDPSDGGPVSKTPGDDIVPVQQTYSAKGLWTFPNVLSEVPDGAFSRADDVVIRRDGIVETRRGFQTASGTFGSGSNRLSALADIAGTLVGQTTANALARYSGGAWTAYTGTYAEPSSSQRMRFLQMAKSLYFTTTGGVYRLDTATGTPMAAGVPQALAGTLALTGSSGFLPVSSQVAYRLVWGLRNENGRLILGAPSGRMAITNPASASTSVNVTLTIPVPSWVTASHFLQVYRSDVSASESIPASDDMQLAYEAYPTASELTAGSMTVLDVTPDALKGASLYSSPNLGVAGSEKFQPPVCNDLAEYKQRMWCAATVQRQRVVMTLLSTDATSGGMADGDGLAFDGSGTNSLSITAGATENINTGTFARTSPGGSISASQAVALTAQSIVRVINGNASSFLNAYYVSGDYDSPGQILIESRNLGDDAFTITGTNTGAYWSPALKSQFTASTLSRTGSTVTVNTIGAHHVSAGQVVTNLQGNVYFAAGNKTVVSILSTTAFTYTEAGTAITWTNPVAFETTDPVLTSDPTDAPNGLAYSDFAEPDAVPLGNYLSVGSANYPIRRILTLGDTLFIFKEDGVWILTGDSPETFSVRQFPTPAKLMAPDSVVTLGNSIYALTDQGVLQFTESGARPISRPIEGDLLPLYSGNSTMQGVLKQTAFAVAYETERELHLWLPGNSSDTYATQAYVYNYATQTWTRWTKAATCGYVLPGSDLEYLGKPTANAAYVERKTRTLADYQDETSGSIPATVTWQVRTGGDPSAYKQWQKVTAYYEANAPTTVTLGVGTEVSGSTASGDFPTSGLPYVTTYIPVDQSRGQTLAVTVSGGQAQKRLALTGLSVDFIPSSTKLR